MPMVETLHDGKPCRVSEMQIGTTFFTVISVESADAKESAYDKVKKLILTNADSIVKNNRNSYQKV